MVSETSRRQENVLNFFIPASLQPQPGEVLWVTFPPEHLLCFDPISEDLIRHL